MQGLVRHPLNDLRDPHTSIVEVNAVDTNAGHFTGPERADERHVDGQMEDGIIFNFGHDIKDPLRLPGFPLLCLFSWSGGIWDLRHIAPLFCGRDTEHENIVALLDRCGGELGSLCGLFSVTLVLTLFAIAYEIQAAKAYSPNIMRVQLAVGLPPAHYGAQHRKFAGYFTERGAVQFDFQGKPYSIFIEKVMCFPQAYAAAVTMLQALRDKPKALIIDQGGMTTDLLLMKDGAGDLSVCESLEHGVITLYNQVKSRVNAELDVLLEESEIDAILLGRKEHVSSQVAGMVERQAQAFVSDLFSTLRERGLELKSGVVVFLGGGSILLRRQIEASGKVAHPLFVDDIRANAKGFELLYRLAQEGR